MNPEARREGLVVEAVGKALMVYDADRDQAHSLNATAALVWQHCDGAHSVQDLARLVQDHLDVLPSIGLVEMTLAKLGQAHLLLRPVPVHNRVSRREVLKSFGTRAAVAVAILPVITTIIAPEPALARSRQEPPRPPRPPRGG